MSIRRVFICFVLVVLTCGRLNGAAAFSANDSEQKWDGLLNRDAYIYTVPKIKKTTVIDGVYVKKALKEGAIVPCRRCPDWLANPGTWRLSFSGGVYRIINLGTGWKSIGTYIVTKDRILLANDPACIYDVGLYTFTREDRQLSFSAINDPCAIKLRELNLSETKWRSCQPPNEEAGITDHWPKPNGCR